MKKITYLSLFLALIISCGRPEVPDEQTHTFEIVSVCNLPGYSRGIDISGDFAYIANDQGGLQIINISDPESTYIVGEYLTSVSAQGVAVRENFAYVVLSSGQGLLVLDISDPSAPVEIGSDGNYTEYNVVAPPDTFYIYIAAHDFFIIENCSIPALPYYDQRIPTPGIARGIFVSDSLAYLTCEQMGLYIYYAVRPDSEVPLLGSIDTPSNARDVYVDGDYAYVADGRAGLVIIDVSDPENPKISSVYDTPDYANDIFISDNCAYVADGKGGLQIVDVTNPEEPVYYGEVETSYAYAVYVKDELIYIADRDMGLLIITEEEE